MSTFVFYVTKGEDDFKEWVEARDRFDATAVIERRYPSSRGYECMLYKVEK